MNKRVLGAVFLPLMVICAANSTAWGDGLPRITSFERDMLAEDVAAKVKSEKRTLVGCELLLQMHGRLRDGRVVPLGGDAPKEVQGRIALVNERLPKVARKNPDGMPVILIHGSTWNGVMFLSLTNRNSAIWTWSTVLVFSDTTNEFLLYF